MLISTLLCCTPKEKENILIPPLPSDKNNTFIDKINYLTESLEKNPTDALAYLYRAELYFRLERMSQALQDAKLALHYDSSLLPARIIVVEAYSAKEQYDSAWIAINSAKNNGYLPESYYPLAAKTAFLSKKYKESMFFYEYCTTKDSTNISFLYPLSQTYLQSGDTLKCRELLLKSRALHPEYHPIYADLIRLANESHNYKEAVWFSRYYLRHLKKPALEPLEECVKTFEWMHKKDSTLLIYRRIVQIDSLHWLANQKLGIHELSEKRYENAIKLLDRSIKSQPNSLTSRYYAGFIEEYQLKNFEKALLHYQTAAKLDTANKQFQASVLRVDKKIKFEAFKQTDEYKAYLRRKALEAQNSSTDSLLP